MRLEKAEFKILQHLRTITEFRTGKVLVHLLLSGGKDSTTLFEILHKITHQPADWSQVSLSLVVHHFNHKQRGAESDDDEQHCIQLALKAGCPIQVWRWPSELDEQVSLGENFQSLARNWRYSTVENFASSTAEPDEFWCLATAHHRKDHAETILHHLIRGCGPDGLKGLRAWTPENRRLRPLLWLSADLCDLAISNKKMAHREDSSNALNDYTRNRIRHVLIKEFESLNSAFVEHLWNLSTDLSAQPKPQAHQAPSFERAASFEQITGTDALRKFILSHCSHENLILSRNFLENILTHINKCRESVHNGRVYKFALSERVFLQLTNKHLEIQVSGPTFHKDP
jgi:tRNA(Ile)-lysidine synthetase-like protein